MSLLLCRREKVKHPFYIEVLGIHIYSSQELCYVIYHHPLLVMNDFVDASLFFFVKNELGLGFLAGRMEKLVEAGGRPEEALYLFLSECDYYTEKEIQKFKQVTASYRNLSQNAYGKAVADYLFSQKQYGKARGRGTQKRRRGILVPGLSELRGCLCPDVPVFQGI